MGGVTNQANCKVAIDLFLKETLQHGLEYINGEAGWDMDNPQYNVVDVKRLAMNLADRDFKIAYEDKLAWSDIYEPESFGDDEDTHVEWHLRDEYQGIYWGLVDDFEELINSYAYGRGES